MIKNITKKIAGLILGTAMILGIGVSLGSTHGEAIGVKGATTIEGTFEKYTAETSGSIDEGDYLIVYIDKAMKNTVSSSRFSYSSVTISNDAISNPTDDIVWHISMSDSYATIYNASVKKYAAGTGAASKAQLLNSGTDDQSLWTISGTSSFEFVNKKNKSNNVNANLRNNGTYGFACYATATGGALSLYKKVEDSRTLNMLEITSGEDIVKKEYNDGQSFDPTGLVVTATYSDETTENVVDNIIWSPDPLTEGTTTVVGTYKNFTVTVNITVNAYAYEGDGTLANPYSIDDAVRLASLGGKEGVFVKGTGKPKWYSSSKTFSVYFPDSTNTKFTFYTMYADKNKTPFSAQSTLGESANTEVLAYGNIILYNGITPELEVGCYIYDYKATSITASEPTKLSSLKAGDVITKLDQLGVSVTANIEVTGEQRDVTSEVTIDKTTLVKGTNTIKVKYTQTNKYSGKTTNNTELTTTITLDNIPQKATKIEITSDVTEVFIGETITLTAKVSPDDTSDPTVLWISDDDDIATIDKDTGVVTGVATGQVKMTACCDDVEASVTIEVKDPNNILEDIFVEGTLQTSEYFVGEKFDPAGLTVSGMYTDTTIIDITDQVVWPSNAFTEANDETTIIVSYTYIEHNVEKTITDSSTKVKVVDKVLSSIAVSGQKTDYTVSDTKIDTLSMKVTASYENTTRTFEVSDSDSIQVSYNIDFSKLGENDVTVSYTENGVTKSTNYIINVGVGDMTVKVNTQGTAGYKKVTADKTDWSGTYLIVYESGDSKYAFSGVDATNGYFTPTITDGVITNPDVTVTIEKMTSGYSIKVNGGANNGKYLNYSKNDNGLAFSTTSKATQTISYNSTDECLIKNSGGAAFRFNNTSGQMRFRYYKSDSYSNQQAICLYEYFDGVTLVDHAVSDDLYTAVQEANDALVCGSSSSGSWIDGTYDADTAKGYLEMLDADDLNLLKKAEADKEGNLVEYFLWKYDYLVSTNKINNFLERSVSTSNRTIVNNSDMNGNTAIMAVVIISFVGITAIGGYLFVRKQKQY